MGKGRSMTLGERLKYARERTGLTGQQVHKRTGIGSSSLSDFENDKREPRLSQLQTLAKAYRRSLVFFLGDAPIPHEVVLWRTRPEKATEEIENHFLRLCEQYHNLEMWCDEPVASCLPESTGDARDFGYADAENLAKRVRNVLQLGDQPGQELVRVLEEDCGVKVFHREFWPSGPAASTKNEHFGSAVLLNSANVRWRRNHDLAHELFHLLAWNVFRSGSDESSCVASEREEKLATCFARNLLMPHEAIRGAVSRRSRGGKLPFEAVFDIARLFDVSVESLMWHLHFLCGRKSKDADQTRAEIARVEALVLILEDPERKNTTPPKWPERYRSLAIKALWRGEISIGRFAEYLEISRQRAMRYVEREVDGREEVQLALT